MVLYGGLKNPLEQKLKKNIYTEIMEYEFPQAYISHEWYFIYYVVVSSMGFNTNHHTSLA